MFFTIIVNSLDYPLIEYLISAIIRYVNFHKGGKIMLSIIELENALDRLRFAKATLNKVIIASQSQNPNNCEHEDTDALCGIYDLLDLAYNDLVSCASAYQLEMNNDSPNQNSNE